MCFGCLVICEVSSGIKGDVLSICGDLRIAHWRHQLERHGMRCSLRFFLVLWTAKVCALALISRLQVSLAALQGSPRGTVLY
jgi:hypothetical protein